MEGYTKDMKSILLFCKSPHVAGTIGEICRDVARGIIDAGMNVVFVSTCEPVSYVESVDGMGYPITIGDRSISCFCGSENVIVGLYETITSNKFDYIMSIGERAEMEMVSAALQVVGDGIEHFHIWTGSSEPSFAISESLSRISKLVCFGSSASKNFSSIFSNTIGIEVRSDVGVPINADVRDEGIICGGPCNDISNLISVVEGLSGVEKNIHIFSNIYEPSDYDLKSFCAYFGIDADFGEEPYGTFYGLDNVNLSKLASRHKFVVDLSLRQSCCYAVDCCIQNGSIPILSRTPRHIDFLSSRGLDENMINLITVSTCKFRPSGGDCIWISNFTELKEKIILLQDDDIAFSIKNRLISDTKQLPLMREKIHEFFLK